MRPLTFISLFAGIGGFDLGFERAGLRCVAQVEKDVAARYILTRRYPGVIQRDDVCTAGRHNLPDADIICGGFPCQDLSVAGKRAGLAGGRSGLFYEMTRICHELRPALIVWENVPGLLSSRRGADFAAVLVEMDRIGYSGCWTTLDAQFFGPPQRRQRVFGVFARHDIGVACAAEILSLATRMSGHFAAGRAARADVAAPLTASLGTHSSSPRGDGKGDNLVVGTLTGSSKGNSYSGQDATAGKRIVIPFDTTQITAPGNKSNPQPGGRCHTLNALSHPPAIAFDFKGSAGGRLAVANTLLHHPGHYSQDDTWVVSGGVRRLMPVECERLQGFPDGWTDGQSDSQRYKQLGNAVNVAVAQWIGQRIHSTMRTML